MDQRLKRVKWGPQGERVKTSAKYWQEPIKWNKEGATLDYRQRVFAASLADVFEDNAQIAMESWRVDLFKLIIDTPNLDWLLLTKRTEKIISMVIWNAPGCKLPDNVWLGASVENKSRAHRAKELAQVPAKVRFLSVEPMLEKITLPLDGIHWVICGGESGNKARPFEWDWARDLREQCKVAGVAFWMKQGGGRHPVHELEDFPEDLRVRELPR